MSGTKIGGKKAAEKNLAKNPNFYKDIGAAGGRALDTGGGFAHKTADPRTAGARGGMVSRRGHKYLYEKDGYRYYTRKSDGKTVKFETKQ